MLDELEYVTCPQHAGEAETLATPEKVRKDAGLDADTRAWQQLSVEMRNGDFLCSGQYAAMQDDLKENPPVTPPKKKPEDPEENNLPGS